ncbi:MAG: response regulator [Desulfobacteraceae bacterium]|nr:response regulator [Desulfobacteraceae bacterium]
MFFNSCDNYPDTGGYEESELLNSAIFEFFTDSFSKEKIMSELSQKGEINDLEQKIIKNDKTPADTILTVKEVKNTRGDLVSIRASFIDISEKKKLENRLLQTNKMEAIGKLAGGIAHDFNNILSAIMGYSELSLYEIDDTHSLKSNLEEILKASTRAKGLIKQILSFSRNSQVIFDDIDIKALIFDSVSMLKGSIPPEISIKINAKENDYKTAGDPIKIHQVLLNLITNSVSAIDREKGLIEITLEKIKIDHSNKNQFPEFYLGRYIRIIVKDNGTGIKSEDLKNIFDPYFSTKEMDKGTGLGLSVVHGIIKSHKGYITVYSEFNKGAEFHIYLPVTEKQVKIEKTYTAAPEGGNEKILLVDDEISILDLERKFLENIGYYVSCETNPLSAVTLIREEPDFFDLVITDITMPEMSGDILIEQIREIRPDIPVIVYTGFNEKMNQIKSKTEYFLMKPIDLKKLAVVIREAVTASNT